MKIEKNQPSETFWGPVCLNKVKSEARHRKKDPLDKKTEVRKMRKKRLTALIGVTLGLILASHPAAVLAEDAEENLNQETSLRQQMDANDDGIIDDAEKAGFREHYRKRFDRNRDGMIDKNERRQARSAFDRAENRWDRREDIRDRRL